eukprot:TRINITY_DN5271_c0_g1_i3.p1 TRINITY_DN5271_c0_g1~~TRINITY_DN5271_c0_g1_i3.p1  ORF type:complete len:545 (-),score=114.75 TRINITY_DN5271_c0_g1_i3:156-1790(-)
MTAMVDFCPPKAMDFPTPAPAADFSCTACSEVLGSNVELRAHCKSERHVYNTKRKLAGLKPISSEAWERKLRESRNEGGGNKGRDHLKAGKQAKRKGNDAVSSSQADSKGYPSAGTGQPPPPVKQDKDNEEEDETAGEETLEVPEDLTASFSPRQSLFDRQHFTSVDKNLSHMWRSYNFYVPDREYCTNLEGLLEHLWHKCSKEFTCLFCNRRFPDAASTRRHMIDKKHTRIGTEARTRRGLRDDVGSLELEEDLEEFYDFTGSTREITEKITEPDQKIAAILRYFDEDRDECLCHRELSALWKATAGDESVELSEGLYLGACQKVCVDPRRGLDYEALGQLYAEGFADLDKHFSLLQDLLAQKLSSRKAASQMRKVKEEKRDADRDEDDEGSEEGSDDDGDSSGTEIVECDDEAEFEEVMRVLGLQPATVLDNGDLRLPSGMIAVNRDVAYIWKQRGMRCDQIAVVGGTRSSKRVRAQLMLSNGSSGKAEFTRREMKREGKRVVAVLKEQQKAAMKLGMQMNVIQKGKPQKFRTLTGDASGGR